MLRRDLVRAKNSQAKRDILMDTLHLHNHFANHHQISDKKCLFKNIQKYCKMHGINEETVIPLTMHIEGGAEKVPGDVQEGMWIVKPGEDTNRGVGISVHEGEESIRKAV